MLRLLVRKGRKSITLLMVRKKLLAFIGLITLFLLVFISPVDASPSPKVSAIYPKGLLVTPAIQFLTLNSAASTSSSFEVANYTNSAISVNLSVEQFSVTDLSYNYVFSQPTSNWIRLNTTSVNLAPKQSSRVSYTADVPKAAKSGGYYFTFLASTTYSNGSSESTAQAAVLLYLKVNGKLIHSGYISSSSIQRFVTGPSITYSFNVINTGNVYYFVSVKGKLSGLSAKAASSPGSYIVIPAKARKVSGVIPSPLLPGIYKATYGYTTDAGITANKNASVVYLPIWFIALILLIILVIYNLRVRGGHKRRTKGRRQYK